MKRFPYHQAVLLVIIINGHTTLHWVACDLSLGTSPSGQIHLLAWIICNKELCASAEQIP